jgi:hypothetical protein
LGLGDYPALAGALGYGAFCLTILPTVGRRCAGRFTPTTLALTLTSVTLGAVYLGTYSKDVFVIPITAIAVAGGKTIRSDVALICAMAAYAYYLREYWFIVAAFYIALRLANRSSLRLSRIALVVISGIVCLAFAIPSVEGVAINHFRESVNAGRAESVEAQTMLASYISIGGELGGILNTCLTLILLLSPIPLLLLGTAYHTLLFGFISVFWGRFLVGLRQYTGHWQNDPRVNRLVLLAIAFVTVQSVFEPDYGSYMRHLTPLLAVVAISLLELEPPEEQVRSRGDVLTALGSVGARVEPFAR